MDPIWEKTFQSSKWGVYPPEHVIRFVASNFYACPDRNEVRLLDAGCGPGACTWYMVREGFRVSGIDGSASAIEQASDRLAGEGLAAELKIGDYTVLPWPSDFFDAAIDNFSFCTNLRADWQKAVDEVYRVLKPGGRFMSASFTSNCWGYGMGKQVEPGTFTDAPEGPFHNRGLCHFVADSELRSILTRFQQVDVERESRTVRSQAKMVDMWISTAIK